MARERRQRTTQTCCFSPPSGVALGWNPRPTQIPTADATFHSSGTPRSQRKNPQRSHLPWRGDLPCRPIFAGRSTAPLGSASPCWCLENSSHRFINATPKEEKSAIQDFRKKPQQSFRWRRRRDYSIQFRKLKFAATMAVTMRAVVMMPPATATAVDTRTRRMIGS